MRHLKKAVLIYFFINLFLYLYMWKYHYLVPFNESNYLYASHHYLLEDRSKGQFNFLRALGQFDAQWYLKIADSGYPENPTVIVMEDKTVMDGLTYAFFPLYPLILSVLNILFNNIEITAFIFTQVMLIANFISLYYVVNDLYGENIAYKTVFLLFLFPFSIFFRSFFSELVFLPLLIWYSYFLIQRKWFITSVFTGLLIITRSPGLFLIPLTLILLFFDLIKRKLNIIRVIFYLLIISVPFSVWLFFNYYMTGRMLYWLEVRNSWFSSESIINTVSYNLLLLKSFFNLPLLALHGSRIDSLIIIYSFIMLFYGLKFLRKELWWISFLLLTPLLFTDTTSFSRYQTVSFPLFVYLASTLNRRWFAAIASVFYAVLLFASHYFINWYWLG
ncbi:hypothetical protein A2153_00700 [Candidatus Gottesmanbacteria bacterium RBG_16_38_7b]|uniref:Glycosyltransferase RgtA/B/C/D-like domain-containing protein n=1 Tax=Candidatus Gottesmanbacteria bacterium RBG_16_38_7b TaxID=1798372 RepID=A0A1F5YFD7_9BACT|nr:MAG: hypothetical protein A2153_00700 [Candidatus Gottesmanbacteria bacterium RBG_16_38_7b]